MRKIFVLLGPIVMLGCLFGSSKMLNFDETVCSVDGRVITLAELDSVSNAGIRTKPELHEPGGCQRMVAAIDRY